MTISGVKIVGIPLGKVHDRGNLVIDNKTPASINGKAALTTASVPSDPRI